MKRTLITVAASLGFAQLVLLVGGALAQDESGRSLNEVVITASRTPRKQSEIGKVVRIINAEQLAKSQGRSLPELLNNVAGLTIGGSGNNPGDIKSVYLRGASAGNTLILIDGIPVNDASGISGEFDISAIAIDQIERIEILKGGNSTLYGSDAVAGVINIITKKGSGKPAADVLFTGGTYNTFKEAVGLSTQIKRTSLAINASNLDTKGFSTAARRSTSSAAPFDRDGFSQKSGSLNIKQFVTARWSLKGNLQYNENEADLDNGAFNDAPNYTYDKTALLMGLGSRYVFGKGDLNINLSQNNVRNVFDNKGSVTDNKGRITFAEAFINYPLADIIDLIGGGSLKYMKTDRKSPFGVFSADSANNNIGSAFASMFLKSNGGFRAEVGGRYNNHSEYGDNLTYTINPSYVINDRYKFFINVSSAYKVPSLFQLYSQFGNLSLKPETSRTYEAGFDLDIVPDKLNFNFSYFDRSIKNVIDFGQKSPGKFGYINQNKQEDKGFETELSFRPIDILNLTAFYSHVNGEVTTPSGTNFNLFRRPKNAVGVNAGLQVGSKVNFNLIYKWSDDRKDRYYDSFIPPFGKTVNADLASFHLLDAYTQYKPFSRLSLFADIKNILDEEYTEFTGYNTRGINFNAGLKFDLL
ncbi:MAG TPA: TonB-dependent receptor [Sphingobacteriaceae bacterium]|nr:TonB-dependent receptor [Sphingobacteriaceae bacterium]